MATLVMDNHPVVYGSLVPTGVLSMQDHSLAIRLPDFADQLKLGLYFQYQQHLTVYAMLRLLDLFQNIRQDDLPFQKQQNLD
jgi:hypothetical protein